MGDFSTPCRTRLFVAPALAAASLAVAIFALNLWRAATQSVVHDEAYTWLQHASGPWRQIFDPAHFDANNHLLHTLLCKASVSLLGLSPFALRLPSVLAGGAFLACTGLLCWRAIGGWLAALTFGCVALNPLVLDFQSAARGYGLALALQVAAMLVICGQPTATARLALASALLGLSCAANLASGPVAAGLAVAAFGMAAAERSPRLVHQTVALVVPGLLITLAFLAPIRSALRPDLFYIGLPSLGLSVYNLLDASLLRATAPNDLIAPTAPYVMALAGGLVPAILALSAISTFLGLRRRAVPPPHLRLALLCLVALAAAACLMVAAHSLLDVPYPQDRTGLALIVLFSLLLGALGREALTWQRARPAAWPLIGVMVLCTARHITELDPRWYSLWRYDAGTARLAGALAEWREETGAGEVQIAASWRLAPSLNWCREARGLAWLEPVTRGAEFTPESHFLAPGWDAYALEQRDAGWVQRLGLVPVITDPVSGAVLAVPPLPRSSR